MIEIEDYYGNTIMSFRVKGKIHEKRFCIFRDCELADIEGDYINDTDEQIVRVQSIDDLFRGKNILDISS